MVFTTFHDIFTTLTQERCMTVEDKLALETMLKTLKKENGHHSLGLLRNNESVSLENNRSLALRRLEGMKRRFIADPNLFEKHCQNMQDHIDNRYAELIPEHSVSPLGRTYYVSHHCTSASTKFRVVFDCSAKFKGLSLNDVILQGPQLTNSLTGVFLRFRQWPVAIIGDIKAMFSQVFVNQ